MSQQLEHMIYIHTMTSCLQSTAQIIPTGAGTGTGTYRTTN